MLGSLELLLFVTAARADYPGAAASESLAVSEASCRVQSCPPEKCADPQRCLTPVPLALPSSSPSPSVKKRQVSLNWQPLTLQEARALLRRRRPRGPGGQALLRRRPPQRTPTGQARAQHPTPGHSPL
uniref:Latent transforming growth factor beta binding protein 4 n=1 Tax=Rousettus aegyptiacus TaxID=9407 RepID=A0A7J8CJD6_ROUAE|nr:latent transforming growth factor beta binding protein 4 [Rousettus aegyptiacus]